jgi:hypothetical protein
MSYIGGTALGVSTFLGIDSFILGDFTGVSIYGGNSCFDNVRLLNKELTDEEFLAITIGTQQVWDTTVLFNATFNDSDLSAGNISGLTNPITAYDIFRKETGSQTFIKLDTVDVSVQEYIDITAKLNTTYIYDIVAKNSTERSNSIEGNITTDWYGTYLINPIDNTVYIFDLNYDFGGFNTETAYQRYDGYSQYSAYSFGNRNFKTGTISAIVNEEISSDGKPIQTIDFVNQLQSFINNGQYKILKTRKGEVLKVHTMNFASQPLNNAIKQQPYSITFNFEEIGSAE